MSFLQDMLTWFKRTYELYHPSLNKCHVNQTYATNEKGIHLIPSYTRTTFVRNIEYSDDMRQHTFHVDMNESSTRFSTRVVRDILLESLRTTDGLRALHHYFIAHSPVATKYEIISGDKMDKQFSTTFLCQGPDGTTKWMTLEQLNEDPEIFNALHAYIHSRLQVRPAALLVRAHINCHRSGRTAQHAKRMTAGTNTRQAIQSRRESGWRCDYRVCTYIYIPMPISLNSCFQYSHLRNKLYLYFIPDHRHLSILFRSRFVYTVT
jgi:hypothetical protein